MLANIFKWFFIISPFVYLDLVHDASGTPRQLYLSFFLFITYFIILIKKIKLKTPKVFTYVYLLYIFILILNSVFVSNYVDTIDVVKRIEYFLFFILAYNINWLENKNNVTNGIITFLIIILCIGSFELFYIILNNQTDLSNNFYLVSSAFSHKNIYSYVILISLPFIAIWEINKNVKIVLFSWALITLLTLQTRSVLLAITIACIYLLMSKKHIFKIKKTTVLLITISTLFISFFLQTQIGTFNSFVEIFDFNSINSERYATISERFFLWGNSLQMFFDHWVLGVGVGNWPIYFPYYGLTLWRLRQGEVIMQRPHNDLIENFNELGILGGVTFALILIYPLLNKSKIKHQNLFNCGLICFFIVSLFSFPQERIIPSILFLTIVAYKLQNNLHLKINSYLLLILFVSTIPFAALCYSNLKSEISFKKYLSNRNSIDQTNSINLLSKSQSKYLKFDKTSTPIDWYIGEVYLKNKNVNSAIKYFNQALEIHPYNIHILNSLGRCYLINGQNEISISYFKKAIQIAPFFENALYNLAHNYSLTANYNQAIKTLKKIEDKKSKKFIERSLFYARRVIKRELNNINFNELYKDILIKMLSNDNWISSIVIKSYNNEVSFTEQLLLDVKYIKDQNSNP